jgi:hypothetical protein
MSYQLVFAATAVWHLLAAYHFILFPARTLARISRERPVSGVAQEAVRFLGAINVAFFVLGVGACWLSSDAYWLVSLVLMCANASQAIVDVYAKRAGIASGAFFQQILICDVLFSLLNGLCLLLSCWPQTSLA